MTEESPMKAEVFPTKGQKAKQAKTPAAKFDAPKAPPPAPKPPAAPAPAPKASPPKPVQPPGAFMPKWLKEGFKYEGVKEGAGDANNPVVVAFYKDAGFPGVKHDDVAWCAAFVGAMLARTGHKPSGSLAAQSYVTWGHKLLHPGYGCVGVKKRSGNAPSWQGHVGFVVAANGTHVWMLGGNQKDGVNVARFLRDEFLAFVWPTTEPHQPGYCPTSFSGALASVSED